MLRGWEIAEKRWAKMLYNRLLSSGVDYLIDKTKENLNSLTDKNAGGLMKKKRNMEYGKTKRDFRGLGFRTD